MPTHDLHVRTIALRPSTLNESERSVEAVLATEEPVLSFRPTAGDTVLEVLRMDGAEVPNQIPLLDSHAWSTVRSVLGSIRDIRIDGSQMLGRLYFAESEHDTWAKVRDGHITDVSIGQRSFESHVVQAGDVRMVRNRVYAAPKNRPLIVNTRWAPVEGSLTWKGADPRAKIRSYMEVPMNEELRTYLETLGLRRDATEAEAIELYESLTGEQRTRADELRGAVQRTEPPAAPAATPTNAPAISPADTARSAPGTMTPAASTVPHVVDAEEAARRAVAAERERVRQITALAGNDVPDSVRQRAIDEGWDVNTASQHFLAAVRANRVQPVGPAIHSRSHDRDVNVRSLAAGLMASVGIADPTKHAMYDGRRGQREAPLTPQDAELGDRLRRMSAVDICRECVYIDTGRWERDPEESVRAAMSGATLAFVFGTSVYAKLMEGWNEAGDSTAGWCDEEDVANFLLQEDIDVTASARLEPHARGATAPDATLSDAHETYRIARYSKKFVADEMDFIDDRLGAIMRVPREMGAAARRVRPDLVYSLLLENPSLVSDSTALFHANHGNLASDALGSAGLVAAILAMGSQRINGVVLNIYPRYLIVPMALSFTADVLLTTAALAQKGNTDATYLPANTADIDRIARITGQRITVVVDDRIGVSGVVDPRTQAVRTGSATNWFLSAGGPRTIRVAYRRGTGRAPVMRSFNLDKGQWGMGWDINLDIGAAPMDYRGLYKSTGTG